jgi:transcriptional regulator with XRE-family HTH domain
MWQIPRVTPKQNANPTREALGKAIRALRKEKGLSQAKLAERSGLRDSYLVGLESGSRNPTWTVLGQLSAGLGVTLLDLVRKAEGV